ncbi:multidrug resistance protein, MATE family [Deinococcus reticulitermitis]|uniref:Multidrug-efflux transporter n=1 Tax=Deinococcus reticulitermitis TaxID=856736 RepID=A0A1H6UCA2_9DEIO|nr:MATE family efflux transporter [Deinococcus reticulitermitis]SEI87287.1 multidrug resistance protein, MATE family [Deinococcus reticulitermitis]
MTPADVSTPAELRALLRLAGPVVVSQFASNALSLIATAVIGRLGARELAAAAYANAAYYLVFIMLVGVMLSVAPRAAQAYGAGNGTGVALALRGGLRLAALLSAAALPLMWVLAAFLPRFAPDGVDSGLAAAYLRTYSLGMLPTLAFTALRGTLEGTGQPRAVTAVALGGVTWAALVGPALAFGLGPLPRLGLIGAAAASVSASWWMAALLWRPAQRRVRRGGGGGAAAQDVGAEVRALFRLGWPIGLTLGAEGGMFSVTTLLMARFGPDVLAAHTVTLQAITAMFMIPLGVASATGVRVGQAAGAGQFARARRAGMVGLGVSATVMLAFAALELLAPRTVLGVFVNVQDPANARLIATATAFLTIAALFQVVDGIQVTANGALRGLQDTRTPLLVSLLAYWVIGLGVGAWLAFSLSLGARGLWFGLTAGLSFAAAALVTRFLHHTRPGREARALRLSGDGSGAAPPSD